MLKVIIHRKALKEFRSLPAKDRVRLLEAIRGLSTSPFLGDVKPIKPKGWGTTIG